MIEHEAENRLKMRRSAVLGIEHNDKPQKTDSK